MRIVLLVSLVLLLPPMAFGAIKKNSEKIAFWVQEPLDTTNGVPRKPDSVHVFTYADNSTSTLYSGRSTTYPFTDMTSSPIDTIKLYGDTLYLLTATISDIDGSGGNFELGILVEMFYQTKPTSTRFYVQIVDDSLNYDLKQARDSAGLAAKTVLSTGVVLANDAITAAKIAADAIGSSELATDAIGASEIATDAITSAELAASAVGEIGDSIWKTRLNAYTGTAGSAADVLLDTLNATISSRSTFATGGNVTVTSIGADVITASSIATDAIGAAEIAASAITSTEAPNLDAAISSRSTLVTTDNIGINLSDVSGTLDSTEVGEGTYQQIAKRILIDTSKRVPFRGSSGTDSLRSSLGTVVATVDTASIARSVWDNDVVALVNRTATATATIDTASIARSVWDNDVVARANRTIDEVDTIVLACINGDTVASAGDFLKTASDYRRETKNIFGVSIDNTTWATDTTLNQLLRQAVVKVNPIMRGVKFKDTIITSWQRSDYNLDSMIGVISVSWQHEDTVQSITYLPLEGWGALAHKSTYGQDDPYLARPSVYDLTDNQIMLYPPPTEVDTVEIVGFRKVYGIVTTSDFSAIPQAYRIPVLYYMAYLVAQSKQNPNTDRLLSEYNKAVSDILVSLNRRVNAQADSK